MRDRRHLVFHASSVLTSVYDFSCEPKGFYSGRAIIHLGKRQFDAVAHGRGAERAVLFAMRQAIDAALAEIPPEYDP